MFRLTIQPFVAAKQLTQPTTAMQKRRIYRWGDMWGILGLEKGLWYVERRRRIHEEEGICLESVEFMPIQAPPPSVDDVWNEEFYDEGGHVWNGLVSVCFPSAAMIGWCSKHGFGSSAVMKILQEESQKINSLTQQIQLPQQQPQQQQNQRPQRSQHNNRNNHGNYSNQRPQQHINRFQQYQRPRQSQCLIMDD